MPRFSRPAAVASSALAAGPAARRMRAVRDRARPAPLARVPGRDQELRHHRDLPDRTEAGREHQVHLDRDAARPRTRRSDRRHGVPGRPGAGEVGRTGREAPLDLRLHAERGGAARPRTRHRLHRLGVGVLGRPGGNPRRTGSLGVGTYVQPAACRTTGAPAKLAFSDIFTRSPRSRRSSGVSPTKLLAQQKDELAAIE